MEKIPEKQAVKRKSTREIRVSTSGRHIVTPKHLQSSSEEQPPVKKGVSSKNLKAEIERLKGYTAAIKTQKGSEKGAKKSGNETVKASRNRGSDNTDVYSSFHRSEVKASGNGGSENTNVYSTSYKNETRAFGSKGSDDMDVYYTSHRSDDPIDRSASKTLDPAEVKTKKPSLLKTKGAQSSSPSEKAAAISKIFHTEYVDDSNNAESPAIARLEIPPSEISQERKTRTNTYLTTQEIRSPAPENIKLQSGFDEAYDKRVPESFLKNVVQQLKDLRETNAIIIGRNKQIFEMLQNQLSIGGGKLSKTLYQPLKGFPMTTIEQFNELESTKDKEGRRKVYDYLVSLGGSTMRGFLLGGLQIIMTDELACQFTWNGDAKTEKLGDTKISNVLYQAAKNCLLFQGPGDKNVYKTEMLQVSKTTKQRFRNAQRKDLVNKNRNPEKETAESIQRRISQLQEMLRADSDADDEEDDDSLQSDHLDVDEDFDDQDSES